MPTIKLTEKATMRRCQRCQRPATVRRYRCEICQRLVCGNCCEAIDRAQGQRKVWCRRRDDVGRVLSRDCVEPS